MSWMGIDNGVSGSVGIVRQEGPAEYWHVPVLRYLDYTKKKKYIHRVDFEQLLQKLRGLNTIDPIKMCLVERPMVNPRRFKATTSALRALEATLIILEQLKIPYSYIDSREWQAALLPRQLLASRKKKKKKQSPKQKKAAKQQDNTALKEASTNIGKRLFPSIDLSSFDDADGLMIAEHCKRTIG